MAIDNSQIWNNAIPTTEGDPAASTPVNFIDQIDLGDGGKFDIATHHGIKFYNGRTDTTGVEWKGITDLEILIPTMTDLIKDPIVLVGTVGADGNIAYSTKYANTELTSGYLVFITSDCTFNEVACEAGDMAIYDGDSWRVVSGENQVEITGIGEENSKTFSLTGTAAEIITVEGKKLLLSIDYSDVKDHITVDKTSYDAAVTGDISTDSIFVGLKKEDDTTYDQSISVEIDLPTALEDGTVTINEKVLVEDDFDFEEGSFPTLKKNDAVIEVSVSNNASIVKKDATNGDEGDFVASIDGAIKSVSFVDAEDNETGSIKYVSSITPETDKTFITGMHIANTEEEQSATGDFVIPGSVSVKDSNKTFVTGIEDAENGVLVSTVTIGDVTFDKNTAGDIVYGLGENANDGSKTVITSVTSGSVIADDTVQWFVKSLGDNKTSDFDVVTNVEIGDDTLVSDSTSSFAASAMTSAKVEGHVLSFTSGSFMQPVKIQAGTNTITGKSFVKGGVKLDGFGVTSADFVKGSISQAETTFTYKNIKTGDVVLDYANDSKYFFDKDSSVKYTANTSSKKINATDSVIKYNGVELSGSITANIPADKVVVAYDNAGTLPSLTIGDASGELTATVDTALSTTKKSWLGIDADKKSIPVTGAYTLDSDNKTFDGAIEVAKSNTYSLMSGAKAAIPVGTFVSDVYVDSETVGVNSSNEDVPVDD